MKMIISPAKKMNVDTDTLPVGQLPYFLEKTRALMNYMQGLSYVEAKKIWNCNDKIAQLNYERFQNMELEKGLTPAVLSYEGLQYQYMAPAVMEEQALEFLEKHLRILSGFYGILRPFDGVTPYRLEMQAKSGGVTSYPLGMQGEAPDEKLSNLYHFWGGNLYDFLETEESGEGWILNLASKEYSKCIAPYAKGKMPFITCVFGEVVEGKIKEKGTLAKMARGEMVRFLAEHRITEVEGVKEFRGQGYVFRDELSDEKTLVFVRGADREA